MERPHAHLKAITGTGDYVNGSVGVEVVDLKCCIILGRLRTGIMGFGKELPAKTFNEQCKLRGFHSRSNDIV
jgi:hypothetical protein